MADQFDDAPSSCKSKALGLLSYQSVKYVHIDPASSRGSFWPVLMFRVLQIGILLYVVLFSIVIQKSYNQLDNVIACSFAKMKGSAMLRERLPSNESWIVDTNDLVYPLLENAVFIATSEVSNLEKQNTTCLGKKDCASEACPADGTWVKFSNAGMYTGVCDAATKKCQVRGWCNADGASPRDPDDLAQYDQYVDGVEEWSLFVRLNADFPAFDVTLNTAPTEIVPGMNQWLIKDILKEAGTTYDDIKAKGAIVLMKAKFECDFNGGTDCKPTWEISRIDKQKGHTFSTGFNFYSTKFLANRTRTVTKMYGLKLEINVGGTGEKFSAVALGLAIGSGLGLLGIASIVTDFMLQHMCKSEQYMKKKFDEIAQDDVLDRSASARRSTSRSEPLLDNAEAAHQDNIY